MKEEKEEKEEEETSDMPFASHVTSHLILTVILEVT